MGIRVRAPNAIQPAVDNIADFFTKWFNANDFVALRDYIMNVP